MLVLGDGGDLRGSHGEARRGDQSDVGWAESCGRYRGVHRKVVATES
jgi:hypothetical protein